MRPTLLILLCALVLFNQCPLKGQEAPKVGVLDRLFRTQRYLDSLQGGDPRLPHLYPNRHGDTPAVEVKRNYYDKPADLQYKVHGRLNLNPLSWFSGLGNWVTFKGSSDKQDDVASVHLAFLGIRPWDDLKKDLETKFTLTPDQALKLAAPIVGASSSSFVDVNNFGLQASGPAVPKASAQSNATLSTTLIPSTDLSSALGPINGVTARNGGTISLPGALQYRAAQSLLQNVTLLNNTIANAPLNDSFYPYVVSLQVTLMPHRRDGAYDVYTDITFVDDAVSYQNVGAHGSGKGPIQESYETVTAVKKPFSKLVPRVIPLLVTDDLEATSGSSATRKLIQLNAALAAASPQVSGSGSYQKYTDAINKFTGEDTNALVTVARLQENVFRVRFGANVQASGKHFSMVPQAHTVHLLLLYPKHAAKVDSEPDPDTGNVTHYFSCSALGRTHMRHAISGKLLDRPSFDDVQKSFYEATQPFVEAHIFSNDLYRGDNVLELSNYVRLNEYQNFQAKAETLLTRTSTWAMTQDVLSKDLSKFRDATDYRQKNDTLVMTLWAALSQIYGKSVFSTDNIQFKPAAPAKPGIPKYDPKHLTSVEALLLDDGTKITGAVEGVDGVTSDNVSNLSFWLENTGGSDKLFARKITPDASSNLILEFASLKKHDLPPPNVQLKMMLEIFGKDVTTAKNAAPTKTAIEIPIKFQQTKDEPKSEPKPVKVKLLANLKSSSKTITKMANGTGTYTFSVKVDQDGKLDPNKPNYKPAYKNFIVTVKGAGLSKQPADFIAVGTPIDPSAPITITSTGDGVFKVYGDTLVTLNLQNIEAANKITITLDTGEFFDKNNQPGGDTDSLEVEVVDAPSDASK